MMEKLATPAGRTAYAERKWLSEAPYGWIKTRWLPASMCATSGMPG